MSRSDRPPREDGGDEGFLDGVADRLAALPTVRAVALGGSRAQGTHGPDSDWDLAIYYRGPFAPADLRAVGWEGEVSEIGGWGGGLFNGGAWLSIEGRRVDVHYRDLDVVEHELSEAEDGRFRVEPLLFHLAGIPSYLLVAELAVNRVLRGELPRPAAYPEKLRTSAAERWYGTARATLAYAKANHAPKGRLTEVAGALATAAAQTSHAVLAARGEWVTNEKRLLERAGLRETDNIVTGILTATSGDPASPASLEAAVTGAEALFERALERATAAATTDRGTRA
ncbi:nucleotidyltransferase domain-containing protein [Streptomyces phyllanthi]|uniref:Nucleotidyltransferase domain-containing protein n=1 Tax=Streptomyces phyllanthi TaxID=1803180 RepID=A0A5N8W8Y0_9ACTN|nr:nucleotidyltransferase domain-containing protein [Streptomyces phyllanthi]MPY43931.1 nucleotidyltransferase domain-containing protein [Streptomyces phyllanthi]